MNTQKLMEVLTQLQDQIKNHALLPQARKDKFLNSLSSAIHDFSSVTANPCPDELYKSLVSRGHELLADLKKSRDTSGLNDKILFYIRYISASVYDIKGDLLGLNYFTRAFIITAALFLALTPQFYGFVLPVFFIIPIFAGVKGVRKRSRTSLLMALTVVPMSIMTGITWIRYFFEAALPDFQQAVSATSSAWNVTAATAQLLIIVPSFLGLVLIVISLITAYLGYKYRNMFV